MRRNLCRTTKRPTTIQSVKGAIQINAIIWSDFYCRTDLVSGAKQALAAYCDKKVIFTCEN